MSLAQPPRTVREDGARPVPCLVRRGTPHDADALGAFATRTFIDTYAAHHDPQVLRLHALEAFAGERQAQQLADPHTTVLLAYRAQTLGGFAQLQRSRTPDCVHGAEPIELQRLYVDRCWHGEGVGAALLRHACAAASAAGALTLWLKVWERNARAIAFYRKSGFADVGAADYFLRSDRLTDRVMVRTLPVSSPSSGRSGA